MAAGRGAAKKENPLAEIQKNINEKQFYRVYLLTGDEEYRIAQVRQMLKQSLVTEGDTMNIAEYSENKVDLNELQGFVMTAPFTFTMDGKRVVILDRTGIIKSAKDALGDILSSVPDTTVMIICEPEVDKRSKIYKWIKKNGYVAEFTKKDIKDADRLAMVAGLLGRAGKRIRRQDAEYFLDRIGTDLFEIRSETDKLISYLGEETDVTREDILAISSGAVEDKIFDMVSAIAAGRSGEAMNLYQDLMILKTPPLRILALILRQYRILLIMDSMDGKGHSDADIAKAAGIPVFALRRTWAQLRGQNRQTLTHAVERCLQTETEIKTGSIGDQIGVETMIVSMSHRSW